MELIANRRMTYATRRLSPGDRFIADDRVARVLIAAKKARKASHERTTRIPPKNELADLRVQYAAVIGKRPFNGWDAEVLREKIAAAKVGE